jgi:ADP-ribosylglycohydrolase
MYTGAERLQDTYTRDCLAKAAALPADTTVEAAVEAVGSGQRVCAHDTVPFAVWCALRTPEHYENALWLTVSGLGDRDTTCAMVGGILGAAGLAPPFDWEVRFEGLPPV